MNNSQHFSTNPTGIDTRRSTFNRDNQLKTSFNTGDLIPIYIDEVLPGDTHKIDTSLVVRMTTPIHPVMDNLYLDIYYFFVPMRLVWNHTKEFFGENTTTKWENETVYQIPQINAPKGGWMKGTIADYLGLPIGKDITVMSLPIRAYCLIWNDWFRDQNLQDPAYINLDDSTIEGSNGDTYQTDAQKGGKPLPVCKFHDYFTSCLPEPQKGPDVFLPLGESAPLVNNGEYEDLKLFTKNGQNPTQFRGIGTGPNGTVYAHDTAANGAAWELLQVATKEADLSQATASTINQLRQAFQIQKFYERDARGGTRYTEIIKSHFGVTSPDQRQQRPEYLGGKRIPINISQVLQTSSTDTVSPQGNTAAYSLTSDKSENFTKSFTEHGYIIGLCCVRTEQTYQQGIERFWSRLNKFDYYWQEFANIGEQAVLNKEIYAQGTDVDDEVFGYQERHAEYRYKPSRISGALRSTYAQPLDSWHFGNKWTSKPVLSDTFIRETKNNVDRTLAVQSSVEDQFIADFYFSVESVRPMPMYGIPGFGTNL